LKRQVLIVGTGFQGICDAARLARLKDVDLHMVDISPYFGGVLHSFPHNGFFIDKGLHLFSGTDSKMLNFLDEILKGEISFISDTPSSGFAGHVTKNYELPDLSHLDKKLRNRILTELLNLPSKNVDSVKNLSQHFKNRFGDTAGKVFADIFKNLYSINPDEVEASEISKTSLVRLKFDDDVQMKKLKSIPHLDNILAARRPKNLAAEEIKNYYPSGGRGMLEFANAAKKWLSELGVKIHMNQKINTLSYLDKKWLIELSGANYYFDKVIWSNGSVHQLAEVLGHKKLNCSLQMPASMVFAIFGIRKEDVFFNPYVQLFDPNDIVARVGAAGLFGNQITDRGATFITCECPAAVNGSFWINAEENIEKIWRCLVKYSLVSSHARPSWSKIVRVPKTINFEKVGSCKQTVKLSEMIFDQYGSIYFRPNAPNFRRDIFSASLDVLEFALR
tara:strand:+ start:496 stop:1839 length:1344 start_codon:yes stop_codon:yes gene_type:complete